MKNFIKEKKMENDLYTYLQLPDNYWVITTTMDIDVQYEEDSSESS